MSHSRKTNTRLSLRLAAELKEAIEDAAVLSGQTVGDFAASTLADGARRVIWEHDITVLTAGDRDRFVALLEQSDAAPNKALTVAARHYKKQLG